jgi:L-fucose/D-arabinose isomerase
MKAKLLSQQVDKSTGGPVIGVFAPCDPRIDKDSRRRAANLVRMTAEAVAGKITLPDGNAVPVVYSDVLVDGEPQADTVARQFKAAGVNIIVGVPDTWAFPQLTTLSLMAHFPEDTPINLTCGNSAPKPGVVYVHATSGAFAQSGRLMHINVGSWPDEGLEPKMTEATEKELIDWLYGATTYQGLKGRRVVLFGHDSMGMETALPQIAQTRNTFGLEITRLDMKLLADMINKKAYDPKELKALRAWLDGYAKDRIELNNDEQEAKFMNSLAMYLVVRDLMKDLDAVGGGFMSQLEWGSDLRGTPLAVADVMESLFNSNFDHNGPKAVVPYATEADTGALLTQLFMTWLSGGNPPLFMDFRKVWEPWEIQKLAKAEGVKFNDKDLWARNGFVDGNNSGSASFNWAGKPGESPDELMKRVSFPQVDKDYFPGGGNSVTFVSPGGIKAIAARLAYSTLNGMFSMVWDEAETIDLPGKLSDKVRNLANVTWPHTFLAPKHATMFEYKHYAPANHLHMTWDLNTARMQYWMDLCNVLSATPWKNMEYGREGIDRPQPLLYVLNGGEDQAKLLRKKVNM